MYGVSFVTDTSEGARDEENVKVKFETLRAMEQGETIDIDSHMSDRVSVLLLKSPPHPSFNAFCVITF